MSVTVSIISFFAPCEPFKLCTEIRAPMNSYNFHRALFLPRAKNPCLFLISYMSCSCLHLRWVFSDLFLKFNSQATFVDLYLKFNPRFYSSYYHNFNSRSYTLGSSLFILLYSSGFNSRFQTVKYKSVAFYDRQYLMCLKSMSSEI